MILFTAAPKKFEGRIGAIQRAAISNWLHLSPSIHVLTFGVDANGRKLGGGERCSTELDVRHSETGTPYINDIINRAEKRCTDADWIIFSNADMLYTDELLECIAECRFSKCMMVGQRIDLGRDVASVNTAPDVDAWLVGLQRDRKAGLH